MVSNGPVQTAAKFPLVLDVDQALLCTDLFFESLWAALGQNTGATLKTLVSKWRTPARLSHDLSAIATPDVDRLPVREFLLDLAHAALEEGRSVHLVSGSDQALVDTLGLRLGLPGPHFGSRPNNDLTGAAKAAFLETRFGAGGYDYVGNVTQDGKPWEQAREVIAVAPSAKLRRRLEAMEKPVEIVAENWNLATLVRELRPHQWVKNLLLLVPLLAAHQFGMTAVAQVVLAILAFSLGASSIYILNDLLDLNADRNHPEKCRRPIAAGTLPIPVAMMASAVLILLALTLAMEVAPSVAAMTLLYMAGSLSYSLWLKKRRWLDVIALSSLFLLRMLTGAIAADVPVPPILLALGFTVFFVLACVKRITALSRMRLHGHLPGRGYSSSDLLKLEWATYGSIFLAATVFLLYTFGIETAGLYENRVLLAFAVVPLILWLYRNVQLSMEGREDYDPVRFVLRDRTGLAIAASGIALIVLAI